MTQTAYIPVQHDDFWTHDAPLFVALFPSYRNEPRMVQARFHASDETFWYDEHEIIPLQMKPGTKGKRTYVMMHPYIMEPQVFMTVGMYPKPKRYADQDEAIGEVLSTNVKGMRQQQIGSAQAWYYPQEKKIVLWECFLDVGMRIAPSLPEDQHMRALWSNFEHWLIQQFPQATHIATPFNDPIAKSIEEYQTFLHLLGYEQIAQATFGKEVGRGG
jgi:hypothetical protein